VRGGVDVEVAYDWGEIRLEKRKAKIMLLAGSDLIQTMSIPDVWSEEDLHHILG
jgi:nicotinamide mononucleotide adenylyltransferase